MISPVRRAAAVLAALVTSLSLSIVGGVLTPASAAEAVRAFALTKGHIDLFEVTYDAEAAGLRLGVKDDTGLYGPGTAHRDPAEVSVVIDTERSQMDVSGLPAAYDFLKVDGSTIYTLPLSQDPDLPWPGWSTERLVASLPSGVELPTSSDAVQLAVEVAGPGNVFTWQNGAFGNPTNRYVDTVDPAADVIPISRNSHVHTSWAFTKPGDYLLTVTPSAATTAGGTLTGAAATYHVHVGDDQAIEAPQSTVAPTIAGTARVDGTVTADPGTWTPEPAEHRYQWLRGGTPITGATTDTYTPVGADYGRPLAVRVTAVVAGRQAGVATSAPVYVADENGELFTIGGLEASYDVGDTLDVHVEGHDLAEGEQYRWAIRPVGATSSGYALSGTGTEAAQGHLEQPLDAAYDGYEIRVRVRQGTTYTLGSEWLPIAVSNAVEPVRTVFPAGDQHLGDDLVLPIQGRGLTEGETLRLVYRSGSPWFELPGSAQVGDTIVARPPYATGASEFAVQIVHDGVVVAISDPVAGEVREREVLVEGVQGVYRVGQTLTASAEVHPAKEGLVYRWATTGDAGLETLAEGTGAEALDVELPMTMDWHDRPLYFFAVADDGSGGEIWTGQWSTTLKVSDADPDTQLLFFENLSHHYHQGYAINLDLVADPALAQDDSIAWEWKWPGGEWAPMPGTSGLSHTLTAEQALDDVQVRATLTFGDSGETLVADPVTIHHDDHGSPARQQPTVVGATSYAVGDTVALTRQLPENGPTVLTDHRWERRTAGSDDWSPIEGATGAELSFEAAADDDGAEYRVSILKPGGTVAYGPSPATTLAVEPGVLASDVAPVINGKTVVGEILRATTGEWTPVPDAYAYEWLAGGVVIAGATGSELELTDAQVGKQISVAVTATKSGFAAATRTSELTGAVTARPAPPAPGAEATTVSAAAIRQVYGKAATLDVRVSPNASGAVTVTAGSRTLTGDVVAGRASVRLPSRVLRPGVRTVAITYAGMEGRFQGSVGSATVSVAKAKPRVRVRTVAPASARVERGARVTFRVAVGANGVKATGKVVVRVGGERASVRLRNGTATVRIKLPRATRPGSKVVRVSYAGDTYVARGTAKPIKLRVR